MKARTSRSFPRCSTVALAVALAAPAMMAMPVAAHAQAAQSFDIPAGDLASALQAFSAKTGIQLIYSSDLVAGKQTGGVSGSMSAQEALGRLLAGTGLSAQVSGNTATLIAVGGDNGAPPVDGERVLSAVRIQGSQGGGYYGQAGKDAGVNGVNGSRDITATEGTKSFTTGAATIAGKSPLSPKDATQSVSILTNEQLKQQNVTDYTGAMQKLPGITLAQGATSLETKFYSRGFEVTNIQIDGGAPLSTSFGNGQGYYPQIDMSIYDHIELLRGAAGQFNSYGSPSGTVNLVRKKPLDHSQVSIEGQIGSWQNYRTVIDATSPLALNGKLRGRVVATFQNNHYFYNTAKDNKLILYGIAELDVTPTTLLSAGASYNRLDSVPWKNGLPRYRTGGDLHLDRSTGLVFPWNRWNFATREIFGTLEQKIGRDWTFKLNVTSNRQESTRKLGYSTGPVNPNNMLGPTLQGEYGHTAGDQLSTEAVLYGAVNIFGQRQEVTIGMNRTTGNAAGLLTYGDLVDSSAAPYVPFPGGPEYYFGSVNGPRPAINVFNFNPNLLIYNEPPTPIPSSAFPVFSTTAETAYINLRLTAFDRLHLTTGIRWSRSAYHLEQQALCPFTIAFCSGKQVGDPWDTSTSKYSDTDISWPPPVNLSFDVSNNITAYAGYTNIYQSQANQLGADNKPIPPATGANWEAGVKWSPTSGRANASIAIYKTQVSGYGSPIDPNNLVDAGAGKTCCYIGGKDQKLRTKGIDAEFTGEVATGLQLSASYNYNETHKEGTYYGSSQGKPFTSIQPKHLYRVWLSYEVAKDSGLSGLTVSGGVRGQSSAFYSGSTCVNLDTSVPPSVTGFQPCKSDFAPDTVDFEFVVPAYVVASARVDYRVSKNWSMSLNIDNIFDKTYYQTTGESVVGGNWYGAPRSATLSVRATW